MSRTIYIVGPRPLGRSRAPRHATLPDLATQPAPATFAAIDAGSNAIRVAIVQAESPVRMLELRRMRCAVRLGHNAFTLGEFDKETIDRATGVFMLFKELFEEHGVEKYRAVATSAAREAANREHLLRRLRETSGIELEVIDGEEEARLVRSAILSRLGPELAPEAILDMGGGSLEINLMEGARAVASRTLPLGAVRLLETFNLKGPVPYGDAVKIAQETATLLERHMPAQPDLSGSVAAASGGNVETLAQIAPGPSAGGMPVLDLDALAARLDEICEWGVKERMKAYEARKDRAEVMAVAAIVLLAACRWMRVKSLVVPGAGVREGILNDLAAAHFQAPAKGAVA